MIKYIVLILGVVCIAIGILYNKKDKIITHFQAKLPKKRQKYINKKLGKIKKNAKPELVKSLIKDIIPIIIILIIYSQLRKMLIETNQTQAIQILDWGILWMVLFGSVAILIGVITKFVEMED